MQQVEFACVLCGCASVERKGSLLQIFSICDGCFDLPNASQYVANQMKMRGVDRTACADTMWECDVCHVWKYGGMWHHLDNPWFKPKRLDICDECVNNEKSVGWIKLKSAEPHFAVDFSNVK